MKVTLGQILTAKPGLEKLLEAKIVNIKTAYSAMQLAKHAGTHIEDFNKKKNDLITELGTKGEDGSVSIKPTDEAFKTFVEKMNDLATVEVELPWNALKLESLDGSGLTAGDLLVLGPFVEEE